MNESAGVALMGGEANYVSFDQGATWNAFDNSIGTPLANLIGVDATIINDSTYCMVVRNGGGSSFSVARTTDSGTSWVLLNTQNSPLLEMGSIQSNGDNVVIAAKNGVHYSIDGGATWTFVTLSSAYEISKFVDYNEGSNTWFVGGYSNDVLISTDQGATWSPVNYGFNSSEIVNSSNIGNQLLLTHEQSSGGRFLLIDSNNNLTDTIEVPAGLLFVNSPCTDANFLPNGNILTSNLKRYYLIDTSNLHVFHYDYPNIIWSGVLDIELGVNYGLTIRNYNSVSQGEPYIIDYSSTPTLYLPATINMLNEASTCAGDDIVCLPFAYYADSVKWYVDNIFITDDTTLVYPTPAGTYATYTITLEVFYNGIMKTEDKTVTFSPPQPPHPFTYVIDSTACYGQPFHVFIDPSSGSPQNTYVEVYYGGQLVAGPSLMTSSNMNLYTSPFYQDDTLHVISYNTGACDNTSDTITQIIDVGPNLMDFSVLQNDSAICIGVDPVVSLENTDSSFFYSFSSSATFAQYAPTNYQSYGAGSDTLHVVTSGGASTINYSTYADLYPPMYTYISVQVSDTMGCVDTEVIDTFRIHRTAAYFDLHSRSYYLGDTVGLSNAYVADSRTWSSDEFAVVSMTNVTDTVPTIVSDSSGFFDIRLRNEPLPGCIDSTKRIIHYADSAEFMDTACAVGMLYQGMSVHATEYDQFGNLYEIGTNCHPQNAVPLYILRKYDQFGAFQWEKKAEYQAWGWGEITGIVIETIDFDNQGNPIIGMWINGNDSYLDDYFDFQPSGFTSEIWNFIAKVDKNTGDLVWKTRIDSLLSYPNFWKITDLVTTNDRIHVSTYRRVGLEFSTYDLDGNFISSSPFPFTGGGSTQSTFIRPSFHCYSGAVGGLQESYWSPQLDVLSTGEVVAVGHYASNNVPLGSFPQLVLSDSPSGMFIMKYTPEDGIYEVDQIASTGDANFYSGGSVASDYYNDIPRFVIDDEDNIIVSAYWQYGPQVNEIHVMDSIMSLASGTFVFSMDSDYNLNWITVGSHSKVEDLDIIRPTGELLLLSETKDNISFGNETNHMMVGNIVDTTIVYTNFPNYTDYPWLHHGQTDLFLTKFDPSGVPVKMKKYNDLGVNTSVSYFGFRNTRLASTPCGDFSVVINEAVFNGTSGPGFEVDGQLYDEDSTIAFFHYSNCTLDDCSFANLPDTIEQCAPNTLVQVQFGDYFNLDSIVYDLLENNTLLVSNQTALVNEGTFSIPTSNLGDTLTVAMNYPNLDTMTIIFVSLNSPNFVFNDTLCFGDSMLISATPNNYLYSWLGGLHTGDTLLYDTTLYNIGTNQIDVHIQAGQTCSISDTLFVEILPAPSNLGYTYANSICEGDFIQITATETNYSYDWLAGQYSGTALTLNPAGYSLGVNAIDVVASNQSGCSVQDTLFIEVIDCDASIDEIQSSSVIVLPNPNTGEFELRFSEIQEIFSVEIVDLSGKVIYQNDFTSTDVISLDRDMDSGQYIVRIHVNDRNYSQKLVIL